MKEFFTKLFFSNCYITSFWVVMLLSLWNPLFLLPATAFFIVGSVIEHLDKAK